MSTLRSDEDWILRHSKTIQSSTEAGHPTILDLACGYGADAKHLVEFGTVVAADISERSLEHCRDAVPDAHRVQLNISKSLPFSDATFDFVLASLSLHYFSWKTTQLAVKEIQRCLTSSGRSIVRLNSTRDTNYGADSSRQIGDNYYQVGSQRKRFFDENAVRSLFESWRIDTLAEMEIDRYQKTKMVWEVVLRVSKCPEP